MRMGGKYLKGKGIEGGCIEERRGREGEREGEVKKAGET